MMSRVWNRSHYHGSVGVQPVWAELTALRGFCAVFVLLSHTYLQVWPVLIFDVPGPGGLAGFVIGGLAFGQFGVVAFIMLSGYSLERARVLGGVRRLSTFYARRCRRIMPPYYAAFIVSLVLACSILSDGRGTIWATAVPVTVEGIVSHALLLQDTFAGTQINYTHWSVALEFHLYLLLPAFSLLMAKIGWKAAVGLLGTVIYTVMALVMSNSDGPAAYMGLVFHFILGMGLAHYIHGEGRRSLPRLSYGRLSVALFAITVFGSSVAGPSLGTKFLPLSNLLVCAATAFWIMRAETRVANNGSSLRLGIWYRIGKSSYSLYLIHAPFVFIAWVLADFISDSPYVIFGYTAIFGVSLSALATAGLYFLVERRFSPGVSSKHFS